MQIHQIRFRIKKKKIIGRGGKKGSYSGRGIKGQKARAGRRIRPVERDYILKIPKLRGWANLAKEKNIFVINLDQINNRFNEGEIVDKDSLIKKNIIKIPKSLKNFKFKILGKGNLEKKLIFDGRLIFSKKALEKINESKSEIR